MLGAGVVRSIKKMENKSYVIQGQSFTLLPNDLNLLNKAAPMIARLRKLVFEYTKDLDVSDAEKHKTKIDELTVAKEQLEDLVKNNVDEHGNDLDEEKKSNLSIRINEISGRLIDVLNEFNNDSTARGVLKLKQELESYALIELLTDTDFLKPILKKILRGGNIDSLNFEDSSIVGFIKDVVTDFFTVMNKSSLKL